MPERECASINLWDLITDKAHDKEESMNKDRCVRIKELCHGRPKFGTELELTITADGTWIVHIFVDSSDQIDYGNYVNLTVTPNGGITVTRHQRKGDIADTHSVAF